LSPWYLADFAEAFERVRQGINHFVDTLGSQTANGADVLVLFENFQPAAEPPASRFWFMLGKASLNPKFSVWVRCQYSTSNESPELALVLGPGYEVDLVMEGGRISDNEALACVTSDELAFLLAEHFPIWTLQQLKYHIPHRPHLLTNVVTGLVQQRFRVPPVRAKSVNITKELRELHQKKATGRLGSVKGRDIASRLGLHGLPPLPRQPQPKPKDTPASSSSSSRPPASRRAPDEAHLAVVCDTAEQLVDGIDLEDAGEIVAQLLFEPSDEAAAPQDPSEGDAVCGPPVAWEASPPVGPPPNGVNVHGGSSSSSAPPPSLRIGPPPQLVPDALEESGVLSFDPEGLDIGDPTAMFYMYRAGSSICRIQPKSKGSSNMSIRCYLHPGGVCSLLVMGYAMPPMNLIKKWLANAELVLPTDSKEVARAKATRHLNQLKALRDAAAGQAGGH
jgi:hypothetical protein